MSIHFTRSPDDIVELKLEGDGPVNLIDEAFLQELDGAVTRLAEEGATGAIVTSAKATFVAGANIDMLYEIPDAARGFEAVQRFKAILRRLETQGKPVVAALNGSALGGGLELALACHYRVAVETPKAQFGFPEVSLGLLPAGGGVTRLTRMLGLQTALPYLIEGTRLNALEAHEAGWIDALAESPEEMMETARAWIRDHPRAEQVWDRSGYRMPGGDPRRPQVMSQVLPLAPAMLRKRTHRNYPAPEAILSAAVEGAMVNFDTATRIESRYFAGLATGQVAHNMMTAFWYQLNEVKGGKSRPRGVPRRPTRKLGVLGAGFMGHGIGYVSALAGMDVVLKDVSQARADAGKAKIEGLLEERVRGGKLSAEECARVLARVQATENTQDLAGCDLVIEAVFEDREVKAQVTQEAEAVLGEGAILGSNTSTLPITGLAAQARRPKSMVGIHFFSPVHKMPLVEIIRGRETADEAIAKAFDYVLQIGKTPIVVNDGRGFYTSRVFGTYVNEGMAMLAEGQNPRAIEAAGVAAGMPVGPLAVSDEVNLALIWHIREQAVKDLEAEGKPPPWHPSDPVVELMVKRLERTGKAQAAGFYEYPPGGKKSLWPGLAEHFAPAAVELTQDEMKERLLFVQALETVRCLEEGVLTSAADANIGSIFGWSFAPYTGGTFQFINAYGVEKFAARARELAARYGARFAPPERLSEMAQDGKRFQEKSDETTDIRA